METEHRMFSPVMRSKMWTPAGPVRTLLNICVWSLSRIRCSPFQLSLA